MSEYLMFPPTIPFALASRIKHKYGSVRQLAVDCGLPYNTVYSTLVKSRQEAIDPIMKLSAALDLSDKEIALILISPVKERRLSFRVFMEAAGVVCFRDLERVSGLCKGHIHYYLSGEFKGKSLRILLPISSKLGMSLSDIRASYMRLEATA